MSEYEVYWNGRGGMPHEERDRRYWRQARNVLLDQAPATSHYIEVAERAENRRQGSIKAAAVKREATAAPNAPRCLECQTVLVPCDMKRRYRRCKHCRSVEKACPGCGRVVTMTKRTHCGRCVKQRMKKAA